MALNRTTEWICDVCGAKEVIVSTDTLKGLDFPKGWDERTLRMDSHERYIVMCKACMLGFRELYSYKEESKAVLKQPFWQKFFGRIK